MRWKAFLRFGRERRYLVLEHDLCLQSPRELIVDQPVAMDDTMKALLFLFGPALCRRPGARATGAERHSQHQHARGPDDQIIAKVLDVEESPPRKHPSGSMPVATSPCACSAASSYLGCRSNSRVISILGAVHL